MPEFYVEEIEIEPYEYVRACRPSDIKELVKELVDVGHLPYSVLTQITPSKDDKRNYSVLEMEFLEKIDKLSKRYHSISKDDEQILEEIFKKYI